MKNVILSVALLAVFVAVVSASESTQARQARFDDRKARFDTEKKEITTFMNTKNLFKTVFKILFGTSDESAATSRQVLGVLVEVSFPF